MRVLLDFPRSPVIRTLFLGVIGAGLYAALVVWVETDDVRVAVLRYALVLPFGLVQEYGDGTVIASMFTFFATMGLELLAGEIEEPFGTDRNDLPLVQIAARIAADVRALLLTPPPQEQIA